MTIRSQKRTAVAELASGEFEASTTGNNLVETLVAWSSKSPKIQTGKLDEIKMSLRRGIMSDLIKILADNLKKMLKLIALMTKKPSDYQVLETSDSEPENIFMARTSTPVKTKTTSTKTTPINMRNIICRRNQAGTDPNSVLVESFQNTSEISG